MFWLLLGLICFAAAYLMEPKHEPSNSCNSDFNAEESPVVKNFDPKSYLIYERIREAHLNEHSEK